MNWHGYMLLEQPAALTAAEWARVLPALLGLLGKAEQDPQPANRLHWRRSNDGRKVIVEATFDVADLDATDVNRLAKYISTALAGKYSAAQVKTALAGKVTVWGGGKAWVASRDEVAKYLADNAKEWAEEEVVYAVGSVRSNQPGGAGPKRRRGRAVV